MTERATPYVPLADLQAADARAWAYQERYVRARSAVGTMAALVHELASSIETFQQQHDADVTRIARLTAALMSSDPDGARLGIVAPEDAPVAALCEQWGYGAVMDSAARQWRKRDPSGALTVGACVATVRAALGKEPP